MASIYSNFGLLIFCEIVIGQGVAILKQQFNQKESHRTRVADGRFVDHHNVLHGASQGTLGDVVGAIVVEEQEVRGDVVLLWEVLEGPVHFFIQHQPITAHLELGRFHLRPNPNKAQILKVEEI